ncbi:hypothetical protein H5410_030395 [Solanum commersonii]|uniref:Uncharacterized protein n=1 Tax=Solanum commersonii TaxID=4109 RepID=A0A9J5YFJ6_SOLCO|nr:hypothetical protein H5410_030395 [Solanum commersonii]
MKGPSHPLSSSNDVVVCTIVPRTMMDPTGLKVLAFFFLLGTRSPYTEMVRNLSVFNLLSSLGERTIGGIGATRGARAGTVSATRVATGALNESGRDLARIFARLDCNVWSSSSSDNIAWESKDSPSLLELCSGVSDTELLPLPFPPFGGSFLPFLGGLAPPSFITTPRVLLRGGMSRLVLAMSIKTLEKKLETSQAKAHKLYCRQTRRTSRHVAESLWQAKSGSTKGLA